MKSIQVLILKINLKKILASGLQLTHCLKVVIKADTLSKTERQCGGFGSTG